jgi:DHA1 family multidrug resistance protein-like MFS transporter
MLPYGAAALFYGPLVRILDSRKIELFCMALFSIANLASGLSRSIQALFVARFFTGLFGASVIPLALILIARESGSANRGRLVGLFFSATFTASLAGLFLSGILPWRMIFLIPAIAGFIACVFIYMYLPGLKIDPAGVKVNYLATFRNKAILRLFTYILLISIFYHGVQQWLGVYFFEQYGFNQFIISMLVTLSALSGIFGEALGGWFSDIIGRVNTVNIGITLMIASVFALFFKMPVLLLVIIMLAWGAGWAFNHAGISTIITDLPDEFLNEAASLNSGVRFIAGGLGVAVSGLLMQKSFIMGFSIFGICLLSLLFFTRRLLVRV